ADRDFVHGYLLHALNLPPSRVQLVDDLTPGASLVAEIERGVPRSRFTVAVLSPAFLEDRWATTRTSGPCLCRGVQPRRYACRYCERRQDGTSLGRIEGAGDSAARTSGFRLCCGV